MLRTFSWLLVPVVLVAYAPGARADVVITKAGERVFGTVLTETPVGVSILEPNGLTRGFYVDEVAQVRRDPATRTEAGIREVLDHERQAAEVERSRLQALQNKREAPFHLGHQLTLGISGESANGFLPAGGAKYRLLVGKYLAAYVGADYGMGLGRLKKVTFDDQGNEVDSKSVNETALSVPFGAELRYKGMYIGGGAAYLMASNVPTKEYGVVASVATVVPQVVLGYGYQFKHGPLEVGPVVGVDLKYTPASKNLPTGFYGGGFYWGWTF